MCILWLYTLYFQLPADEGEMVQESLLSEDEEAMDLNQWESQPLQEVHKENKLHCTFPTSDKHIKEPSQDCRAAGE